MSSPNPVIAIFCSDIHLTLNPPAFRSTEPDWMAAMKWGMKELEWLKKKYECNIFCAGDLFDTWKVMPELVNWAIINVPYMHAIPGQHDLPYHNTNEMHKSPFTSLVLANKIKVIDQPKIFRCKGYDFTVYPFAWGESVQAPKKKLDGQLQIAIAHQYNWIPGYCYKEENAFLRNSKITQDRKELRFYDVIVYGDNHKGFKYKCGKTTVFNCGSFFRRSVDELLYRPRVGLLHASGQMETHYLDISRDKCVAGEKTIYRIF
jgi:predicted phosphodiesterase